jgi:hypothetical protein
MIQSVVEAIAAAVLAGVAFMAAVIPADEADQYPVPEIGVDSDTWVPVTTLAELEACYLSQGEPVPWWAYTEPIGDDMTCEIE